MKLFLLLVSVTIVCAKIICSNDDPTDCYPQVFEPTNEWQIIRPGQDIPGGLHVRLNVDTLQREAKLMDPNDLEIVNAVVLSNEQNESDEGDDTVAKEKLKAHQDEQASVGIKEEDSTELKNEIENYPKIDMSSIEQRGTTQKNNDSNDFNEAVDAICDDTASNTAVNNAIDTLIELSHDLEYGIKLASKDDTIKKLLTIAKYSPEHKERVYRLIGSCLRNNPEAIDLFMINESRNDIVKDWIKQLSGSSDIIIKRILGIFESLVNNNEFKYEYLNKHRLLDDLISIYPKVESSKGRIVHIFEDLKLIDSNTDSDDTKISSFLQNKLISSKFDSEDQFKLYYNKLVELHESNKTLKGTKDFVAWLDKESLDRHQGNKPRDTLYSNSDTEFDKQMLETRHKVFGNPNALRKHFDDEL